MTQPQTDTDLRNSGLYVERIRIWWGDQRGPTASVVRNAGPLDTATRAALRDAGFFWDASRRWWQR